MTAPRQVLPGTTYLLTRRCSERRFFLKPSEAMNQLFLYVLGVAAQRHRILVHAVCVLSNHYHLLVTDPHAELPRFMQFLDALVARATNRRIRHREALWSTEASYNAVTHGSLDDMVAKAAYILANPVAAGLVQHGREWPGVRTAPEQLGSMTLTVKRPTEFFRRKGRMLESVELNLTVPPGFASAEEFQRQVGEATLALEAEHRRIAQDEKRSFLGHARVLAMSPYARPSTAEPFRALNPRIAARDTEVRVQEIERELEFQHAYREAWEARQAGAPHIFPAGTYLLRVMHGVRCAAPA